MLANEPAFGFATAGLSDCPSRSRRTQPGLTILAHKRGLSPAVTRAKWPSSLGRTLPESRLRRLPFGILSRCQLPRPNCQGTKRADDATHTSVHGTTAARDCHGQRFVPGHPERASTHDTLRASGHRHNHGGTSRLGDVTSGEAGTDLQATRDRPHLHEKLAEGFGTVKRPEK